MIHIAGHSPAASASREVLPALLPCRSPSTDASSRRHPVKEWTSEFCKMGIDSPKNGKKTTGFHGQAAKIVRISWLLLFWKATSTSLALEIERRFKCSPFGARGDLWFQNRKACCQRWNHQLFVYIHCFSSIYYMILCFLLSMHKPFLLEIQTGLLWVRKRPFVSPNTLHHLKPYWPLAVIHKLFLVEIELRMVNHPNPPQNKNNVFGTWI